MNRESLALGADLFLWILRNSLMPRWQSLQSGVVELLRADRNLRALTAHGFVHLQNPSNSLINHWFKSIQKCHLGHIPPFSDTKIETFAFANAHRALRNNAPFPRATKASLGEVERQSSEASQHLRPRQNDISAAWKMERLLLATVSSNMRSWQIPMSNGVWICLKGKIKVLLGTSPAMELMTLGIPCVILMSRWWWRPAHLHRNLQNEQPMTSRPRSHCDDWWSWNFFSEGWVQGPRVSSGDISWGQKWPGRLPESAFCRGP